MIIWLYDYIIILLYGAVSFVLDPGPCTERPPRKESYPLPAPCPKSPGNFWKNSRPPAEILIRSKYARPPARKKMRRPSAGPNRPWKKPLENAFLHRNLSIFEKLRFCYPKSPNSTSGPSFSESPRQTIWGTEVLVQIRALRTPFVANQRSHQRGVTFFPWYVFVKGLHIATKRDVAI